MTNSASRMALMLAIVLFIIGQAVVMNDILYFDATTHDSGRELWAHDPYDGSTWLVVDISKGNASHTGPDLDSNPGSQF
ncbi:MAG: hypothetical protein ACPG60_05090, partial [Poseidonia sp.]